MDIHVSGLFVYPVKSCRGISLERARVGERGILYDREWMIVDGHGQFLTQRVLPRLSLIEAALEPDALVLRAIGMPELRLQLEGLTGPECVVTVWKDDCRAYDEGPHVAGALSRFLGQPCRLVRMTANDLRQATSGEARVGFSDGYPFLLISEASLIDLNSRLPEPLPMNRFRPNIVVDGCESYAEDSWKRIKIGSVRLDGMTQCTRCAITTTDQATAERGHEPLRTLATYRRTPDGVVFGRNFNHLDQGELCLGDKVHIT